MAGIGTGIERGVGNFFRQRDARLQAGQRTQQLAEEQRRFGQQQQRQMRMDAENQRRYQEEQSRQMRMDAENKRRFGVQQELRESQEQRRADESAANLKGQGFINRDLELKEKEVEQRHALKSKVMTSRQERSLEALQALKADRFEEALQIFDSSGQFGAGIEPLPDGNKMLNFIDKQSGQIVKSVNLTPEWIDAQIGNIQASEQAFAAMMGGEEDSYVNVPGSPGYVRRPGGLQAQQVRGLPGAAGTLLPARPKQIVDEAGNTITLDPKWNENLPNIKSDLVQAGLAAVPGYTPPTAEGIPGRWDEDKVKPWQQGVMNNLLSAIIETQVTGHDFVKGTQGNSISPSEATGIGREVHKAVSSQFTSRHYYSLVANGAEPYEAAGAIAADFREAFKATSDGSEFIHPYNVENPKDPEEAMRLAKEKVARDKKDRFKKSRTIFGTTDDDVIVAAKHFQKIMNLPYGEAIEVLDAIKGSGSISRAQYIDIKNRLSKNRALRITGKGDDIKPYYDITPGPYEALFREASRGIRGLVHDKFGTVNADQ